MFTGLTADLGEIAAVDAGSEGARLRVRSALAAQIQPGDSVSVNGACLTAARVDDGAFEADVMNQTLAQTALGDLTPGDPVNLELALRADERLGGHFVQGHVDGTGEVIGVTEDGLAKRVRIAVPEDLRRYVVERGSIAVDGVSLTIAGIEEGSIEVSLIPETLERTTLGDAEPGRRVNLECDVLAKYVERLSSR